VPDAVDRRNIERAIFHCLGLDTGVIGKSSYQFNNDIDGMQITERHTEHQDNHDMDGWLV